MHIDQWQVFWLFFFIYQMVIGLLVRGGGASTPDNGSNLPWDTIYLKAPHRVIWWGFFVAVCSGGFNFSPSSSRQRMVSLPEPGAHQIGTARTRVGKDRHIGEVRTIGCAIGIHLHGDIAA